jgi:methyl-accepting chemotaxis protein
LNNLLFELEREYRTLSVLSNLELNNRKLTDFVKAFVLTGDSKWEKSYDVALFEFDSALEELYSLEKAPQNLIAVRQFESLINELKGIELLILSKAREGEGEKAKEFFDLKYEQRQNDASRLVVNLVENKLKEVNANFVEGRRLVASAQNILLSLFIVAGMAMLAISFFLASFISSPIKDLSEATKKIMQGDLKTRVKVFSRDEVGVLAEEFNEMTSQLEKSRKDLEEKIQLRTKELEEKVNELENIRETMVRAVEALEKLQKKGKRDVS